MSGAGRSPFVPGVYLVTDTLLCGNRGVVGTVRAAVAGGIRTVQIREKNASASELYELVLRIADAVGGGGGEARVLVNDRVDVYLAARAAGAAVHGVHIGQGDLPAAQVRAIVGDAAIVGVTANTLQHLRTLHELPQKSVDYLGVGVIRATSTKLDHPVPLGVEGFASIVAATRLPCVAIGGVTLRDVRDLRDAGAAGVAVVSAICAAADPESSAKDFVQEWTS